MPEPAMPKVCLAVPMPPPYGGIANWSRMVTMELRRQGVHFEVVNTAPRRRSVDGRSAYERFVVSGVDIIRIAAEVRRAVRGGCGVLHLTTSGQFAVVRDLVLLRLARRMRIPSVYHVRFGRVPEIRERDTREWRWLRRAISLATVTIAIDQSTFESLRDETGSDAVVCIPNPVDLGALPPASLGSEKSVVYLGWVIPSKGIGELLTAWTDFFSEHEEWKLKLIGPVPESYGTLLADSFSLSGVEFCGELDHDAAMRELAHAGIFVLPSHTEGFPNVLLEAMALGRACIGTAVGAIPEMLADGGGYVVDPGSSRELLGALLEVSASQSLRSEMDQRARAKVLSHYSLDAVLAQYLRQWVEVA